MNIRVDQLQRARSVPGAALEWVCVHLASKAWLTDRVWHSFDIKLHASDQITLNERFHISEVVMGELAMPKRQVKWESGSWVCKLCNWLSHTIQECSIVVIDGGDEQWWSTRLSDGEGQSQEWSYSTRGCVATYMQSTLYTYAT